MPTLTAATVRNAKPKERPYKLADGAGLYLLVQPTGARYWRLKYRFAGTEKLLAVGVYPEITLADARVKREEARALLRAGADPSGERKREKMVQRLAGADTFGAIAAEWQARQTVSTATAAKTRWLLDTFALPYLGSRPIAEITAPELLAVLRRVEHTGKLETALRVKVKAGQIIRYAIATGRATADPTASLRGALTRPVPKHHAAITDPKGIGALLRAIDSFTGYPVTIAALKLAPLLFVRPGELRAAEWGEIDFDAALWRIPAARMKMRAAHLVPLCGQAIDILRDLKPLTGAGRFVFPSARTIKRPMSENALTAALRRLGYTGDEMTVHGFRSMAAVRLNEMGWNPDAIERQLAHAESNKVRDAYTSAAQYLDERKRMMQAWADYLDGLRSGADIILLHRTA